MSEPATTAPAEPTPLQRALIRACEFAVAHDVDSAIIPADFGIQRSEAGQFTATYVDGDHAVIATINRKGDTTIGVAELEWMHDEFDEDRDPCRACGECMQCGEINCECTDCECHEHADPDEELDDLDEDDYYGPPMIDVYLPGDAPAEATR